MPINQSSLGFRYTVAVVLAAGLAYAYPGPVLGFEFTGWLWTILFGAGVLVLLLEPPAVEGRTPLPYLPWLVYYGFLWLSLAWCDDLSFWNVQSAAQASMPLLVGVIASRHVRREEQLQRLLRCFGAVLVVSWIFFGLSHLRGGDASVESALPGRVLALTAALIGCVFAAAWPPLGRASVLGWAACLLLALLTESRMATFAMVLVLALHPALGHLGARVVAVLGVVALGLAVFHTPIMQERTFGDETGDVSRVVEGDFLSFGRLEVWPLIWEKALERPVLGAGVGSSRGFVAQVWDDTVHPHNDYLRVFFETGAVGVSIFLAVLAWQAWQLKQRIPSSQGVGRQALAAALLGLFVFLITAATDNPLVYALTYMNPWFILMGAAYGVAAAPEPADQAPQTAAGAPCVAADAMWSLAP